MPDVPRVVVYENVEPTWWGRLLWRVGIRNRWANDRPGKPVPDPFPMTVHPGEKHWWRL